MQCDSYCNSLGMILSKLNPFTNIINFPTQASNDLLKFLNNDVISRVKDSTIKKKPHDMIKHQSVPLISIISFIFFFSIDIVLNNYIVIIEKCNFIREKKNMSMIDRISLIKLSGFYIILYFIKRNACLRYKSKDNYNVRFNESLFPDYNFLMKKMPMVYHIPLVKSSEFYVKMKRSIRNIAIDYVNYKCTRIVRSYEFPSTGDEQIPFIIDICKLYGPKSVIILYTELMKEMEMTTTVFKWRRSFSREEMLVRCGTENILREWYSIDTNRTEINDVATWSLEKGITKMVPDSLYERRHNLQGLIMRAVIVKDSPFASINKNGELDGIYGKILKELCVTLNFSFDIVSEVEQYGRWNPEKKTWSGAIAELYAGRADISLSEFSITNARLNAVDFTLPILISKNCLFFRKPEIFAIKWSSYFLTFAHSVWIAMFGVLIAALILLIFLKIKDGTNRKIGNLLSDNFLEIWGIFCQQGIADFSDKSSLRIAYFSIFFFVTVISAAYSAALISFLTSVIHVLPFHSLESFVEDGTYQFAVFRGTAYYDKFANSEDPFAKKVMKLMLEEEKLPLTISEGLHIICKNRNLVIYTFDEIKKSADIEIPCNVVRVETRSVNSLAIVLSKHNPFTGVINFQLQKFVNNGIINRLRDATFKKKSDNIIKHQPVPLTTVISLIFFIQIGIILGICILIIEKCIFARKRKKMSIIHHFPSIKLSEKKKNIRNIEKGYINRKCARVNSIDIETMFIVGLKILILLLPKIARSQDPSIGNEQTPFIIDICKLYGSKSAIFLYSESINGMEMTTMMFKWTRALSREGVASTNLYFSQLHKSSYYIKQIVRPYYIAVISSHSVINEFSLATSTFDMSSAMWLVIFVHKENGFDYCHNPPGNIFHLRFNSEMMVRCGTENILREWYSIDMNRTEIDDVATWSLEKGIINILPDPLYERRYNLKGLIMRAVIIKNSSFITVNKDGELGGTFGEVVRELCTILNFSFNVVSESKEFGRWNPENKTWSGAIEELYAGRADISLSGFSVTNARLNVVDFTVPFLNIKNFLVIREPEKFGIKWSSHFLTFTNSVWIAIIGVLIGSSILLIFLKINNGTDRKIGYLFIDNLLEIWGIFCQQGLADFSGRSSLRIAYFSVFILVTVLSAAYSAGLISFLTSTIHVLPFHSLEGFVQDGTYQLAVVHGTAYYDKFANSGDPLAKKLMKLMLEDNKLPLTDQEGYKRICKNRKLAFYTVDKDVIANLKIPCNVVHIATGHVNNIAMILSKHNPFTDKYVYNGMMNRLKQTTIKKKSNNMIKHQPVPIISVILPLIFILIGIVFSTCILIIEKLIFARTRKKMLKVHHIPLIKSSGFYVKRKKSLRNIAKRYASGIYARKNY
ncbi:LOW QUALITY PROTEIN: glutamate receptor 1-like isoform X1 [Vespula squamosa]|uniref:Glutamate receptor 1-like isoform X1 n=1 Tax=Vespula squamosa TaxID=30214 RepID=A0ABD1ZXX5_VESSQ